MSARVRIGELLINAGLLRRDQLEQALEQQRAQGAGGRRLGQLLVDLGFVSEPQLTKVLSQQLSVPWVSLHHIDFSRQLLNLVPREVAEEFCLVPVYVRHERKVGDTLYLAMDDPTHDDAIRQVMAASGMPVKAMIAPPSDIRGAIRAFYGSGDASDEEPTRETAIEGPITATVPIERPIAKPPPTPATAPPPRPPRPPPTPATAATARPSEPLTTPSTATVETTIREEKTTIPERPRPIRRLPTEPDVTPPTPASKPAGPRMLALTLLDGTTIQIPAQKHAGRARATVTTPTVAEPPAAPGDDRLTTRDLIAALRAVADGANRDEALGDATWETLLAALLSLLLKKQLIADWEFVEEWQRH